MNPGTLAWTTRQHRAGHVSGDPTDNLQRHGGLKIPTERVAGADGGCPMVREEEREGLLRLPQPVGIHVFRTHVPTCAGYVATRNRRSLFCSAPPFCPPSPFGSPVWASGHPPPSLVMSYYPLAVPCTTSVLGCVWNPGGRRALVGNDIVIHLCSCARPVPSPPSRWELGSVVYHSPAAIPTGSRGRAVSSGHARWTSRDSSHDGLGSAGRPCDSWRLRTRVNDLRVRNVRERLLCRCLVSRPQALPKVTRAGFGVGSCAPAFQTSRRGRGQPDILPSQPRYETRTATEGGTLPRAAGLTWRCFSGVRWEVGPTQTQTPRFAYGRARGAASIGYGHGSWDAPRHGLSGGLTSRCAIDILSAVLELLGVCLLPKRDGTG